MLDGLAPELAPRLLIAIGGVAVAFLVLIFVLMFLRRRNSPLFVKGGRAREHRLLVMDAAAIDAKRRLVLIRRDNTEHLIMIGGPTDIVIETGIGADRPASFSAADRQATADVAVQIPVAASRPEAPKQSAPPRPAAVNPPTPPRMAEAGAAVPAQAEPDMSRRAKAGQPADAERNQRRMERQAARAQEPAKAAATDVSAMGSVLYGEDGGRVTPVAQSPANRPSATQSAENELERARARVLQTPKAGPAASVPAQPQPSAASDSAIKALQDQLESTKARAARIEAERQEAEQAQQARAEAARVKAEAERAEAARLEAIRIEAQKAEARRLEAERAQAARLEEERAEAARSQQRAEAERAEAARAEAERLAAARAEAMARFEAARRAQAEQRQVAPSAEPATMEASMRAAQWPPVEPTVAEPVAMEPAVQTGAMEAGSQQRLASDFEKLLEAELEADGVLDSYQAPVIGDDRRDTGFAAPDVSPATREPITGAAPGLSVEQDMARRLGEISLSKKTDSL
jgi:hypothetical protein